MLPVCYGADMISVVIPAHNEERYLSACLTALARQETTQPFEVIVVDNASTDRTAAVALGFADRLRVRVVPEEQKGRGAARHAGFMAARGDIILTIDADSIVPPHWIELMVAGFQDDSVVGVTGTCYVADQSWLANAIFNAVQPAVTVLFRLAYGTYWVLGTNGGVRRSAYLASDGFDRSLNAMEDSQYSLTLRRFGKIRWLRTSRVQTSGRRFQQGIIRGLLEYVATFFQRFLIRRDGPYLRDVR